MEQNFNRVTLCGTVAGEPYLSHINHAESFYKFPLDVPRLSGQCDRLTVVTPGKLLEQTPVARGDTVRLVGQLRSFNNKSGQGRRLVISVFARRLEVGEGEPENCIQLSGIICKQPILRRTPLGRDICDIILAVNRRYGRADYLPCIAWGAVAQQTADMGVGRRLTVEGRVQSRVYTKVVPGGTEERVAYEVSIMRPAEIGEFLEDME
jgi:single-stranded DNA-binding protein